ncbi:hypothetical protein EV401DRAFT_1891792 [Pisolithus croceorrhizus]|nr:hypothetical protein EV401DRAFT_1891792 [Pisolithus croceorrhizus]
MNIQGQPGSSGADLPLLVGRYMRTQHTQRNAVGVPYEIPVTASLIDLFQWIHEMTLLHDILVEEALVTLAGMSEEFHCRKSLKEIRIDSTKHRHNSCMLQLNRALSTTSASHTSKTDRTFLRKSYQCLAGTTGAYAVVVTDPRTQQISSGRWISYSAWRRHVKEEETRVKLERSRDDDIPLEANLLAATLSEPRVEDCVLSSHSVGIQHTSNGVSGRPFDGELRMADIDMVDVSQTSDDDAHDTREKLSLLAEYRALFLSQKSCLPPTSNVVFTQPPELSSPDTPGPLDMKKSALFLAHQSAIGKTMELVDSVSSQSHDSVRTARRNLIREIQDYQGFLERIVTQEWLRQKAENVKFKSYLRSILPELVDNCHHRCSMEQLHKLAAPLVVCMITAIVLHILAGGSHAHSNFLLVAIWGVVSLALFTFTSSTTSDMLARQTLHEKIQSFLSNWPSDIHTAINELDLKPSLLDSLCGQACQAFYEWHLIRPSLR